MQYVNAASGKSAWNPGRILISAAPALVKCSNCGSLKLPHQACGNCGYYKGEEVIKKA